MSVDVPKSVHIGMMLLWGTTIGIMNGKPHQLMVAAATPGTTPIDEKSIIIPLNR